MTVPFRTFLKRTSAIVALAALLVPSIPYVFAALASPASDTLSRLQVGVAANHEIVFLTPTGVDASSDTVTVSLPDFTFGSVAIGDVDLFHGTTTGFEIADTLAAAPGAGTWGLSIAGTTLTFTAPTDAGAGTVPAGNRIAIRIGTNAVGGTNQLTNPASPVIAFVTIGGTFGDSATFGVPIVGDDSVSVTATVVATSSGGGGGGGSGDTVAPTITNVQAINITTSTATITWDTNENSDSIVEYGLTIGYGSGTVSNASYVINHSLGLSQLTPATTYHFRVFSRDGAGNQAVSGDYTFTTLSGAPPPDVTPPVISNVQVANITDTSALVTWDTDEPATSVVNYGTTTAYAYSDSTIGLVTSHAVQLNGLAPSTLYHFSVISADGNGNAASSTDATFTTLADITPPTNVNNFIATPGDTTVALSWTNPGDPDFAGTRIMRKEGGYPSGPFDGTFVYSGPGTSHLDTGLTNGVTYYYGAYAFDGQGNFASGALANATPQGPPPPPENTDALCSNGIDDDLDGQMDCFDSGCAALPICAPPPTPTPENTSARCSNGVDDDKDGATDCADSECATLDVCKAPPQPPQPPQPPPTPPTPEIPGPTPTPSPPPGEPGAIIVQFYGAGGTVPLSPDAAGRIGILAGSSVFVSVPVSDLGLTVIGVILDISGPATLYSLQPNANGTAYTGTFSAPPPGLYAATVIVTFDNNTAKQTTVTLNSQPGGRVVEETVTGPSTQGVSDADLQLFRQEGGAWVPYASQITGPNGGFAFVVPNGRYYAEVDKEGYRKGVSVPVTVTQNVFNDTISLIRVPELKPIPPGAPVQEQIAVIASNVTTQVSYGVKVAREVLDTPAVQAANTVAAPTLLAMSLVNTASAISAFNLLAYAQYLFTQPLLLFGRRRRKKWGVVFNSLTKQPIDLAIVRLVHGESRLVIQTKVTDKFGRYAFLVKPGSYFIEIVKPGYVFPTQYLKGKKEDVDFVDLYHGDPIKPETDTAITMNIPLDPVTSVETPSRVLWRKSIQALRHGLAFSAVPLGMVMLVITPGLPTALLLLAQIGVYLLFRRIALPAKAKSWGITFDASTRHPIGGVIVRIFDKKFNKLLETQVTDRNGKYGFFVRRNVYYVTAEKPQYQKYTSPDIDLSAKDEALVDQNIPLKKA